MNSLKCNKSKSLDHCLTELFPIYRKKYWTIRQQDDCSIDPLSHRYIEDCWIFGYEANGANHTLIFLSFPQIFPSPEVSALEFSIPM